MTSKSHARWGGWFRTLRTACWSLSLATWSGSALWAQVPPAPEAPPLQGNEYYLMDPDAERSGSLLDTQPMDAGVGGFGMVGRAGHVVGPTVGRSDSVTYFDLMPYMFVEDTMYFGDMQFNIANNGHIGGSAGMGIRQYFPSLDTVGGLMVAYDHDATRSANFEQLTVAHEVLSEWLDIRTNVYLPFGRKQYITRTIFEQGSQQFTDFNITFQRRSFTETAMTGFENLYTIPIPGEFAEQFNLDFTAGWYHYQAPGSDMIWGYKVRADADILDRLGHMFVEYTGDRTFGQNVIFAADVNYWHDLQSRPRLGGSQYNRMANWVRRNRTVVSDSSSFLNAREVALNPDTGVAYRVYHVRHVPGELDRAAPDGSITNPFNFMQQGIDALPFGDIVFVHSNSVFDGTTLPAGVVPNVVLRDNVLVLGEGTNLTLPVVGLTDEIPLPTANNPVGNVPVIRNVIGDAVTFANNSRFSGFDLESIVNGSALVFNGVTGGRVDEVSIDGVTGGNAHGVSFNNAAGAFSINGLQINNTIGDAFRIIGGTAAITVGRPAGDPVAGQANVINNSSGFSTFALDAGGSLFFRDMVINDTGGQGIAVRGTALGNSRINVTFDTVNLLNTNPGAAAAAVDVVNHSGLVSFQDVLSIDGNNGIGINIDTLASTGAFTAQEAVLIDNRNATGLRIVNLSEGGPLPGNPGLNQSSRVSFLDNVTINGPALGALPPGPGVLFSSGAGSAQFNGNLIINRSAAEGILINNIADTAATTGQFRVTGITQIDTTAGTALLIEDVLDDDFQTQFNGIQISNRLLDGVRIDNFAGRANLRGVTVINNEQGVGAIGLNINAITQAVNVADVTVVDQLGPGPAISITNNRNLAAPPNAVVTLGLANVQNSIGAVGVLVQNNDDVTIGGGIVEVAGARGVDVQNNLGATVGGRQTGGHDITFESVSATGADFGILVRNSRGRFEVTGNPINAPLPPSGGTIAGMNVAGALFQNTNQVRLAGMTFDSNFRGVVADLLMQDLGSASAFLELESIEAIDSTREGVLVRDVVTTNVFNSTFDGNGFVGFDNQIEWAATQAEFDIDNDGTDDDVRYGIVMTNNRINDSNGLPIFPGILEPNAHALFIHSGDSTAFGGVLGPNRANEIDENVVMDLQFGAVDPLQDDTLGNFFTLNRSFLSAMDVDWRGAINASINDTLFDMLSDNATGLTMDIAGVADVVFQRNTILSRGDLNTGIDLVFDSATALQISDQVRFDANGNPITQSGFAMLGIDSTAISLTFNAANNDIFIERNLIEFPNNNFFLTDSTGIIFNRILGPSNVTINNNRIDLSARVGLARGIFFARNEGTINLSGDVDNAINLSTNSVFFNFIPFEVIPIGSTSGSIIVNGSPVP